MFFHDIQQRQKPHFNSQKILNYSHEIVEDFLYASSLTDELLPADYFFTMEVNGCRLPLILVKKALADPKFRYISKRTGK
jgi:hypothetical protein